MQDIALQLASAATPAMTGTTPLTPLAFLALETGAVAILELRSMKLLHRIAYKRIAPSSRLRVSVRTNSQMVALAEDDNLTTYKGS